jgi:phosphohistidine phosphatase
MHVLIIRHAIAAPHGTPGVSEDNRPLTPEGEKRFRESARGLARVAPRPDAILTSRLPRARRTAEIAAEAWGGPKPQPLPALEDGDLDGILEEIEGHGPEAHVVLVGHEPSLSSLLARLIGSDDPGRLAFKKGGAALVEVPGRPKDGGTLEWFMPPRTLRELAGS